MTSSSHCTSIKVHRIAQEATTTSKQVVTFYKSLFGITSSLASPLSKCHFQNGFIMRAENKPQNGFVYVTEAKICSFCGYRDPKRMKPFYQIFF